MGLNKTAWCLTKTNPVALWLLLGWLISTAAFAAVEFKDRMGEALIGTDVRVSRYTINGVLDYRIEARKELRSLKINEQDLLIVEAARLRRLQYVDGLFIKSTLRLKFATAQSGAGQLKLLNVQGELNGQPFKALAVNYRIDTGEFVFTKIRYFNEQGFRERQNVRYFLSDDGTMSEHRHDAR